MKLSDIEAMDVNVLTVKQVAEFLGKDPQTIRDQAEREPKYLGFPICKAGHSYCIPREGFITWVKGHTPIIGYTQGLSEQSYQASRLNSSDDTKWTECKLIYGR